MKRLACCLVLSGVTLLGRAAPAAAGGFQVDLGALLSQPAGDLGVFEDETASASDVFDTGFGVIGDAMVGLNDNVYLGAQLGAYWSSEGGLFDDEEDADFTLLSVPIHGLMQFRSGSGSRFGFWAQGGLGVTRHSLDHSGFFDDGFGEGDNPSQTSLSWLVGAGVSFRGGDSWDLTLGANYHQAQVNDDDGELWREGDNPKFVLFALGVRWRGAGY